MSWYREVVFINPYHNGDLFISRELVRFLVDVCRSDPARSTRFAYAHGASRRVLIDLGLEQRPIDQAIAQRIGRGRSVLDGDTLWLSTWYGSSPVWDRGDGCTLNTLYALFQAHAREWFRFELDAPIERFVPRCPVISVGAQERIRAYFASGAPAVLVANARPMSDQSALSDGALRDAVLGLARDRPDLRFLVTNKSDLTTDLQNVGYTADIIGDVGRCDLPEHSILSCYCRATVGRSTGPFTFSYVAENIFDPDKRFVSFVEDERIARWIYPTDVVKAHIVWSRAHDASEAYAAMAGAL